RAAIGLGIIVYKVAGLLEDRFHASAIPSIGTPDLIASALPSIAALGDVLRNALIFAAVFGAIVALAARLRRAMLLPLGMVLACGLLPLEIRTPGEFALQFVIALVTVAAAAVVCLWLARDNYLA